MGSRPKQSKRPVSFSGCWTCKERKVKCDENPNGCAPCSKMGVPCGGYDIKLQWVSSKTEKQPQKYRIPSAGRRRLKQDIVFPFCSKEIDKFLNEIDMDACSQSLSVRGPFTIFPSTLNGGVQSLIESIEPGSQGIGSSINADELSNPEDTRETPQSPSCLTAAGDIIPPSEKNFDLSVPFLEHTTRSLIPLSISSGIPQESSHQGLDLLRQPQIYLSEDPKTNSLFHHYSLHVADILQPLSHPSNPYLSIYVPAAIEGLSEVTKAARVPAPSVKLCTFHALIATAAFHLHSCNSFTQYHSIGVAHRQVALQCMQLVLSKDLNKSNYKDLMMAMLSLITIGVMEGRIIDFQIHLKAMLQLRSASAQQQLDRGLTSQTRQLEEMSAFMSLLAYTTSRHTVPSTNILPNTSITQGCGTEYQEKSYCFESTYGVTSDIVEAIQQTLQIHQWLSPTHTYDSTNAPIIEMSKKIEDLGSRLMNWTFNEHEAKMVFPNDTTMQTIFTHHAKAWHNATTVYYTYVTKRTISPNFTINYSVSRVAEHLHAVEDLKIGYAEQGVRMAPITWPAFVASCCAESSRRETWEQWWDRVQCYGIGSLKRQYEVVREVWSEMDQGGDGWLEILLRENIEVLAL